MRFESIFHPITYETLIIPIKFLPIPQLRLPYIGTRADSSDLLRPLPLDTQSSWRASTLPRSPPFSPAPRPIAGGGGGGGSGRTSSLTDAIHRVIFPFFPPFFLPPLPSWRPPSRGRCPAPTIFAISRHPIFSVLRVSGGEGRGGGGLSRAPSTRPLSYFPPGNTAPTRKTIWLGWEGGRRPVEKAHWLFTRKIRGACV